MLSDNAWISVTNLSLIGILLIVRLNLILGFHHHHDSNGMEEAVRKADQQETNVTELMETNGGFRNLTNNGVPRKRVVGIISAVTAGIGLLKGIASQIDVGRVCVIGLSNHGNRKLIEPTWYLQHGIIHDPLPREIAPGDAGVFTFEKTQYSVFGTSGILSYTVEGTDLQVEVLWSVPIFYGPESNIFNVEIEENTEASIMTYKYLFNNDFQKVSNGGHWLHRNHDNIQVHAAMTNNAKASLLVEVFYNLTSSVSNPFGK